MADNYTVTKEINETETQFLFLTMSHIEYKIGKILSDYNYVHMIFTKSEINGIF